MTIQEFKNKALAILKEKSPSPSLDIEVLLSYILGYTKTQILLNRNQEIPENKIEWLNQAVDKRSQGLPVAYITGHKEFYGYDFYVSPAVLIPKPDTEILVITESGFGKRVDFDEFSAHGRGTSGQRIFGNVDSKGEIIGALTVKEDDSIMCITSQGTSLRVELKDISKQGRGSSGVRVVDIQAPDYVIGIDRIASNKENE